VRTLSVRITTVFHNRRVKSDAASGFYEALVRSLCLLEAEGAGGRRVFGSLMAVWLRLGRSAGCGVWPVALACASDVFVRSSV